MRKQIEEDRKTTVLSLGAPNGISSSQKEPEAPGQARQKPPRVVALAGQEVPQGHSSTVQDG